MTAELRDNHRRRQRIGIGIGTWAAAPVHLPSQRRKGAIASIVTETDPVLRTHITNDSNSPSQHSTAMALSPSAQATSPLARQLLRHVSSGLVAAAFHRPAPAISLPSAPRGADDVALAASHHQRLRPAPSPKGRPGAPKQGSGGQVHAAPAMATIASAVMPPTNAVTAAAATTHVVTRGPARPGLPAQGGGGGKTHGAPAAAKARAAMPGPAPPARPKEGSGGKVHVASPAAMSSASVLMRGPAPPGHPAEGAGGRGGSIHSISS